MDARTKELSKLCVSRLLEDEVDVVGRRIFDDVLEAKIGGTTPDRYVLPKDGDHMDVSAVIDLISQAVAIISGIATLYFQIKDRGAPKDTIALAQEIKAEFAKTGAKVPRDYAGQIDKIVVLIIENGTKLTQAEN